MQSPRPEAGFVQPDMGVQLRRVGRSGRRSDPWLLCYKSGWRDQSSSALRASVELPQSPTTSSLFASLWESNRERLTYKKKKD